MHFTTLTRESHKTTKCVFYLKKLSHFWQLIHMFPKKKEKKRCLILLDFEVKYYQRTFVSISGQSVAIISNNTELLTFSKAQS